MAYYVGYIHAETMPYLRQFVTGFPPQWPRFDPRSIHVGFVVNEVALGKVSSEYFSFPSQFSFHQMDSVSPHPTKN
jgi:hypothetical protein